jgi:hypothetical protein
LDELNKITYFEICIWLMHLSSIKRAEVIIKNQYPIIETTPGPLRKINNKLQILSGKSPVSFKTILVDVRYKPN